MVQAYCVKCRAKRDIKDPKEVKLKNGRPAVKGTCQISAERLKTRIGKEYQIVIDEVTSEGAVGRCYADAPEVDGVVHLNGVFDVEIGSRVWAEIIHTDEHDIWGALVDDDDGDDTAGKIAGNINNTED